MGRHDIHHSLHDLDFHADAHHSSYGLAGYPYYGSYPYYYSTYPYPDSTYYADPYYYAPTIVQDPYYLDAQEPTYVDPVPPDSFPERPPSTPPPAPGAPGLSPVPQAAPFIPDGVVVPRPLVIQDAPPEVLPEDNGKQYEESPDGPSSLPATQPAAERAGVRLP